MKPGDIVLIMFPFTNLSGAKLRPCVVASSSKYNSSKDDITLCAITSVLDQQMGLDIALLAGDPEFARTGLKYESVVKIGKIVTLEKKLIKRKLGELGPANLEKLQTALALYLDLTS